VTTPRSIRAGYERRIAAINSRKNVPEQTRKALIAKAWLGTREQLRTERAQAREAREQAPAPANTGEARPTMSQLIRAAVARPDHGRARGYEAVAYGLATPRELTGLGTHEIERLARQADFPDDTHEADPHA